MLRALKRLIDSKSLWESQNLKFMGNAYHKYLQFYRKLQILEAVYINAEAIILQYLFLLYTKSLEFERNPQNTYSIFF